MVETVHGESDLFRSNGIEAHFLWEELADQAVHILVRAALPGSIGMSEEEVCVEFNYQGVRDICILKSGFLLISLM